MDWPAFEELAPGNLVPGVQGWTLPPGAPRIPLNLAVVARRVDLARKIRAATGIR